MKRNQQGFTLIELMIVIAIIAILMAYAIPAYRDYTVRAKAGECMSLSAAAKQSVSEYYLSEGALPTDNAEAGLALSSSITGENVASIAVAGDTITCTFNTNDSTLSGSSILFVASTASAGSIEWNCTSGLADRYLPTSCR